MDDEGAAIVASVHGTGACPVDALPAETAEQSPVSEYGFDAHGVFE